MNSDPTVWWKECTLVFSDADGGFVCFAADGRRDSGASEMGIFNAQRGNHCPVI